MTEDIKTNTLELETKVALAEIYFTDILTKLTSEQKVEALKIMLKKFDPTNPILEQFGCATITTRAMSLDAWDARNTDNYCLVIKNEIENKLQFVKILKEHSGMGLKDAKDCVDHCTPNGGRYNTAFNNGIFAYNLSAHQADELKRDLESNCTMEINGISQPLKIIVSILNYKLYKL